MPLLIVRTLGELIAFALCAFAAGSALVTLARRAAHAPAAVEPCLREGAVRMLAGFGTIGYVAAALALVHALHWWVLALVGGAVLVTARRELRLYARAARRRPGDRIALAGACIAVAMACGQFLAALAPSEAYDELAYHLPIARAIGSSHAAAQLLHAHDAYGNLPSLGECLYAAALAVDGTALVHAVQLAVVLAFVALAAAFVRELCGARAGSVAAIALLAYPGLTYLATTGYVDAAATAFEVGALLLALRWLLRDAASDLPAAALLLGLAVSVKYTALFTVAALGVGVVAAVALRRTPVRPVLAAAGVSLVAGGFWYAKNLIRFGNPFWPFYLGHRSMDDPTYDDFVRGIHAFGPRTATAFLEVPWRLAGDASAVPFVALSVVVVALTVERARWPALYALLFTTYWFWIASHQVRFLLSGVVVAIVAVVVAVAAGGRVERAALALAATAALVVVQVEQRSFSASAAAGAVLTELGSPKADYALGLESRDAYIRRYAGCQADAVAYLDAHPSLSPVLVRQTVLAPWFARRTTFGRLPADAGDPARALRELRAGGFHAALTREDEPAAFASTDAASAAVRARLHAVWRRHGCTIFRVRS
jgi:hypothetical protein